MKRNILRIILVFFTTLVIFLLGLSSLNRDANDGVYPFNLQEDDLDNMLNDKLTTSTRQYYHASFMSKECEYYLKKHNTFDDGFIEVSKYASYVDSIVNLRSMERSALMQALTLKDQKAKLSIFASLPMENRVLRKYSVFHVYKKSLFLGYPEMFRTNRPLVLRRSTYQMEDSLGRKVMIFARNDSSYYGERFDEDGIYRGYFSKDLKACGEGKYYAFDGSFYSGYWNNDMRNGFCCGFIVGVGVQAGEWKDDKFLGEKMTHSVHRIYGIDISRHQHEIGKSVYPIKWDELRITHLGSYSRKRIVGVVDYPVRFMFIKSTEGTTIRNRYFYTDYQSAKDYKIPVGAYHFFSTGTSGNLQAEFFLRNTLFQYGDLPPVLDVEPTDQQVEDMGGYEVLFSEMRKWLAIVERELGRKPILYVSQSFFHNRLSKAPDLQVNYNVWIARYGEYKPYNHLSAWQLSQDGKVRGITGDVDINLFNGFEHDFRSFCGL